MSVTNLDFLKEGGLYPPNTEIPRLYKYKRYKEIFDSKMGDAYMNFLRSEVTGTINSNIANQMQTIFTNPRIMNYGRAITKKTVDLAVSRKPALTTNTDQGDLDLLEVQRETKVWKKVKMGLVDVSRYGNSYIREYNKKERIMQEDGTYSAGEAGCNVLLPELLIKVVSPYDKEDIQHYVVGWVDEIVSYETLGAVVKPKETEYYLTVEVHSRGEYYTRRFKVSAPVVNVGTVKQYYIEKEVPAPDGGGVKKTGLEDFAIKHLTNFATSDDPLEGLSDYDMFDSLMIDLCQRVSQLSEVFERHGDPAMQGSPDLMSTDGEGNPVFYTGEFYPIKDGEVPLSYITWDAKSKDILDYCNNILQQIFILSEMGDGSIMGYTNKSTGFAESGKAIRMKMASPLMKVQSILSDNEDEIISMIHDFSVIMGKKIDRNQIEVAWKDGLPIDWVEETNNFNARVAAGTESIRYGLQRRFNMTPEEAEDEYQQILKEKKDIAESSSFMQQNSENGENALQKDKNGANIESERRETVEKRNDANNNLG